jgi:hypothetical protein
VESFFAPLNRFRPNDGQRRKFIYYAGCHHGVKSACYPYSVSENTDMNLRVKILFLSLLGSVSIRRKGLGEAPLKGVLASGFRTDDALYRQSLPKPTIQLGPTLLPL